MDSNDIKFSVIVPIYNSEQYLDKCVQSVLCQTYKNFELILIDDGSTDKSGLIGDKWSGADERVIFIQQKNCGASAARNNGIRNATGDYLIFLDSDDWWLTSSVLHRLAEKIAKNKVDILSFNFSKSYNGILSSPYFAEASPMMTNSLKEIMDKDLWISSPWNKVISSRLFSKYDMYFIEGITSEDIDWCLRLAINADTFSYTNIVALAYRQTNTSVSHSLDSKKLSCLCRNVKKCIEIISWAETDKKELLLPYVSYQYGTLLYCVASLKDDKERYAFKKEIMPYSYLLKYSHNSKVIALNIINKLFGMHMTIFLLSVMHKIRCVRGRT